MSRLFGAHKCAVAGCAARIPRLMVLCYEHYSLVPSGLQQQLLAARDYGLAWKCHPTQEYIDLRDRAVKVATREAARKFGRPQGEQLPLLPAT